ncbi:uncharacterized protein LOC133418538 [Cololabis saira]|uniref:uncharacterized protein LOC133418538 n=1 Tax=Cololabis saira TaxID=129043 RepID=UPI002AD5AB2E|nr:uncharacterized protein LOC133418538 [Cololabis saira]
MQDFPPMGARPGSPPGPVHPADRGSRQPRNRDLRAQPGSASPSRPGATAGRHHQPRVPSRQRRSSRRTAEQRTPPVLVPGTTEQRTPPVPVPGTAEQRTPAVLVVGTSMVRHVRVQGGRTFCHPGARVKDVESAALRLCDQHSSASTLVLEAGINDLRNRQSEVLKQEFRAMVDRLLDTGKRLVISGPLPPPRYGDVTTSRLRQLHRWLKGYCLDQGIPYVDNFMAFLNRPHLFKHDGLHPNQVGSRILSVNIDLTVQSCTTTS